ncbi:MAG TPA: ribonuclease E inhibitor RraB, partial [Xanthomonadales bacterium]|nr:ribonuclease E inhibitor RraB [Xanthomonadales bacterium]
MNKQEARKRERALADDAEQIKALAHGGSDLSQPHALTFAFQFRSLETAEAARGELAALGFAASEPQKHPNQAIWRVSAGKPVVPTLVTVHHLTIE